MTDCNQEKTEPKSEFRRQKHRRGKYRRARVRHFLFTHGPNRLSGGRLVRRHLGQPVVVRNVEIEHPKWPAQFDGMRIGHVSDFHLGDLMPVDRACAIIDLLAEQRPDLVACTGDLVDLHHDEAPPVLDALASIGAPLGSFMVLGNHDELHCGDTLTTMARTAGIMMLQDDAVCINHDGGSLMVAGIGWARTIEQCTGLVDRACGEETHVLLAHNPKAFVRSGELQIPLTLSGHTHGGQVVLRPISSRADERRAKRPYRAGLYEAGHSRLYVTAGVGAWFPLRLNCPPEIAMITVRCMR